MFEVGKEVICIKSHSQGEVKKGQRFAVNAIRKSECGCRPLVIDIGRTTSSTICACGSCYKHYNSGGIKWFSSHLFAPIDNTLSELTTADILNEPQHA